MIIFTVCTSLISALLSCFGNAELRRLCSRPWLIAAISYVPLLFGAYYFHEPITASLAASPEGWLSSLWYGIVWLGTWVLLLIGCVIASGSVVAVAAGSYHSLIARYVLEQEGVAVPEESEGVEAAVKTASAELQKLVVLLPLGAFALVVGLIPGIGVIGLALGLILAGYQFLDYAMEALDVRVRKRFAFARRHLFVLLLMGIPAACIMGIPFAGLLLPPIAVAAASRILARKPELLAELQEADY